MAKKKAAKKSKKKAAKKKAVRPSLASKFGRASFSTDSRVHGEHPAETRGRPIGTTTFGVKQTSPLPDDRPGTVWDEDAKEAIIVREALERGDHNAEVLAQQVSGKPEKMVPHEGGMMQAMANQTKTMNYTMRNDYWCCLVFVTAEQRVKFVQEMGWKIHEDVTGLYYDGLAIAKSLDVELEETPVKFRTDEPDLRLCEEVGVIPKRFYGKDWKAGKSK
jgi:hypothetical protein